MLGSLTGQRLGGSGNTSYAHAGDRLAHSESLDVNLQPLASASVTVFSLWHPGRGVDAFKYPTSLSSGACEMAALVAGTDARTVKLAQL